jgi:ATP-dependent DNA helicase RecG
VANEDEIRILSEKRTALARTWDARPCTESSLADIATDIFALSYLPQAVDAQARADDSRDVPDQMAGLRLFDIGAGAPTNAAVILFGTNPLYFIAGAYVQYVRYAGEDAGTEVLEDRRFTGDLLSVLRGVVALAKEVAVARPVAEGDTHERMVYDYPPKALHELLVNALIHRNYDGACAPTIVSHYSDRIEIQNPGGLYGDLTPELFPNGTAYRNPVLAEGARVLGFANRFGRGIALAQSELKRNGSPPASFVSDKPHFNAVVRKPQ